MARVGVDLDGVCFDFNASLAEFLVNHRGWDRARCTPSNRWEFYLDWGMTLEEFITACDDGVDEGVVFSFGEPFPGVREALQSMRQAGHTLHIVTDRSFGLAGASERATSSWLARHNLPWDSLTFSRDKTVVNLDVMVDDKPANYEALRAAGVMAYLHTRPWNEHHPAFYRVDSLAEFAHIVNTYEWELALA